MPEPVAATVRVAGRHLKIIDNRNVNRGHWRLEELRHPRFAWTHDTWAICEKSASDARLILEDGHAYTALRRHAPQLRSLQPIWMRLIAGPSTRANHMVPMVGTLIVIGAFYALAKIFSLF